ncbi:hypothetical protein TNCV_1281331 [Trichonephila clavipes]|nr:hypothetical protein TNCV_1281331 [Trichonephila clavipes]
MSCCVVTNATCLTKSDQGPRNSSWLRARIFTPVVSLCFEHHAGYSMILLGSTLSLRENNLREGQGPPTSSTNHTRGLAARRLFRVPPCREGTIHLQTSMSSPGFEPSPD